MLGYANPALLPDAKSILVSVNDPQGPSGVLRYDVDGGAAEVWWTGRCMQYMHVLPPAGEANPSTLEPGGVLVSTYINTPGEKAKVLFVGKKGAAPVTLAEGLRASAFHQLPDGRIFFSVWPDERSPGKTYLFDQKTGKAAEVPAQDPAAELRGKLEQALRNRK